MADGEEKVASKFADVGTTDNGSKQAGTEGRGQSRPVVRFISRVCSTNGETCRQEPLYQCVYVCVCVRLCLCLCLLRDIRPSQEGKLQGRGIDWKDQHSFLLGLRKARNLWTNEIPPPVGQLCYHKQRNGLFFCDFSIWVFFSFHDRCCCCCSCL